MKENKVRDGIIEILEQNGVYVSVDDYDSPLEINSITYVTMIVDLERFFDIEIDNQYLAKEDELNIFKIEQMVLKSMKKDHLVTTVN